MVIVTKKISKKERWTKYCKKHKNYYPDYYSICDYCLLEKFKLEIKTIGCCSCCEIKGVIEEDVLRALRDYVDVYEC